MSTKCARLVGFLAAMLLAVLATMAGPGQSVTVRPERSLQPFRERVASYTELRRQIVSDLLHDGIDPAADGGKEFRQRLGFALRDARRQSQPGEIFCPEVAGHMRQVVWNTLRGDDDLLSEVPIVRGVKVNDFYPEGEPLATVPPSLLRQFEPLPPELQYRFLSNALILLDIDAALIVDFIPNAFERTS
jgi:hypothetical protein